MLGLPSLVAFSLSIGLTSCVEDPIVLTKKTKAGLVIDELDRVCFLSLLCVDFMQ